VREHTQILDDVRSGNAARSVTVTSQYLAGAHRAVAADAGL
jgi:hypothetical protein